METLRSMFIPGLLFSLWFATVAATLTQLAEMGGALETADAAQRAHQVDVAARQRALTAIREAHNDTSRLAQSRRFQ